MRRYEAVILLAVALALIVGGLVWLFHAWGMVAAGLALAVVVLFVVDVKDPDINVRE